MQSDVRLLGGSESPGKILGVLRYPGAAPWLKGVEEKTPGSPQREKHPVSSPAFPALIRRGRVAESRSDRRCFFLASVPRRAARERSGQGVEARSSSHSGLGHTRVSTQEASGCSPAGSRICITHTWFLGQPRQSDQEATEPLPVTLAGP